MIFKLEYKICDICKDDNTELLFESKDHQFDLPGKFNVVRCLNCGLVYLNPVLPKYEIAKYYPSNYGPHQGLIVDKDNSSKMRFWLNYVKLFGSDTYSDVFSLDDMPKGKILDIGCGGGTYLKELNGKNWVTYGIDISPSAAIECEKLGLNNIFVGELHEAMFPDRHFDVITLRHSLEHIHNPSTLLKEIYRLLDDNGSLLIGVPNIKSIEAKIFRSYWSQIDSPRHLLHFSPKTLGTLLDNNEFYIAKVVHDPSAKQFVMSINYLLGKRINKILNSVSIRSILQGILYPMTACIAKYGYGTSFAVISKKKEL